MIRPATPQDAPAIAGIWNRIITDTLFTFTTVEKQADVLAAQIAAGTPWWVAVHQGRVLGHATYGAFRGGPGYARTMEHSIHLDPAAQGLGLGRALMAALEHQAHDAGVHVLVAGVSGDNTGAQSFHRKMGFTECGRVQQAGFKWGRWLDLVLMQKILT